MDKTGQMRKGWIGDSDGGSIASVTMDVAVNTDQPKERATSSKKARALFLDGWNLDAGSLDAESLDGESTDQEDAKPSRKIDTDDTTIDIKPLITSLLTSHSWHPGEAMMIGVCNKAFIPTVINPLAPQRQEQSLFVIHLFTDSIGIASPDITIPKKSTASIEFNDPSIELEESMPIK